MNDTLTSRLEMSMQRGRTIGLMAIGIAAASIAACQKSSDAASTNAPPGNAFGANGTSGMKRVDIYDPMFQMVAFSMMIPQDWVIDATVVRVPFGPTLVFRASAPDGLTGVQALPRYDWIQVDNASMKRFYQAQQTPLAPPMSAEDFLRRVVVPEARPGAQVTGSEVPKIMSQLAENDRKQNEQFAQQAASSGGKPQHMTSDASVLHLRYDLHGHPVEELMRATTSMSEFDGSMGNSKYSQGIVVAARAPMGKIEEAGKTTEVIFNSITANPEWVRKSDQFALQSNQDRQRKILENAERYRRMNAAIFNASMRSAKAIADAGHAGAMGTAEHMGDVQSMIDPSTGQPMKVSNQYNFSYVDESGNVVHTNSATYNPNAQMRGNWIQLQPIKPQ